jgi:hypothetical protein
MECKKLDPVLNEVSTTSMKTRARVEVQLNLS